MKQEKTSQESEPAYADLKPITSPTGKIPTFGQVLNPALIDINNVDITDLPLKHKEFPGAKLVTYSQHQTGEYQIIISPETNTAYLLSTVYGGDGNVGQMILGQPETPISTRPIETNANYNSLTLIETPDGHRSTISNLLNPYTEWEPANLVTGVLADNHPHFPGATRVMYYGPTKIAHQFIVSPETGAVYLLEGSNIDYILFGKH